MLLYVWPIPYAIVYYLVGLLIRILKVGTIATWIMGAARFKWGHKVIVKAVPVLCDEITLAY